jgi:conjugative transfer signal peptidase TraF
MTFRSTTMSMTVGTAVVVMVTINAKPAPLLIWNASQSVPIGLYRLQPADQLAVADLVVATPEGRLAGFLAERGYLPFGVPLIKHILAAPGQTICRNHLTIMVDGIEVGAARERDHRGRQLPAWEGCQMIGQDEVFLMNRSEPASLDGRYFGPIRASTIVGRAQPLWTFEGP